MSGVPFCTKAELLHRFNFLGLCSNVKMKFSRFFETLKTIVDALGSMSQDSRVTSKPLRG